MCVILAFGCNDQQLTIEFKENNCKKKLNKKGKNKTQPLILTTIKKIKFIIN